MKRRILALSMAAVTAMTSTSLTAFADNENSEALAAAITVVKSRIDIPEELSEFSYSVSKRNQKTVYELMWSTPDNSGSYLCAQADVCGDLILSYNAPTDWNYPKNYSLAKLSGDELYKKAQAHLKKIDPTIANVLKLDRDSLNISLYNNRAYLNFVRTKNGVPVKNDSGRIVLDKDTGELLDFSLNWHPSATFQSAKTALSEDKAKQAYAEMIGLMPQYEFEYDWQTKQITPRIVYRQTDYGEINAFTGKKSDFTADGYFSTDMDDDCAETEEAIEDSMDKGNSFTPQEQAEINKDLPYGNKDAVIKLLQSNEWFTFYDDMELNYSNLYRQDINGKKLYFFTASFTNENWNEEDDVYPLNSETAEEDNKTVHTTSITLNAETGEVIEYNYSDSEYAPVSSYDIDKANALAAEIAAGLSGDKLRSYRDSGSEIIGWEDQNNKMIYLGSSHGWDRYENDIKVSGDRINISFDKDMRLTNYRISYTDVALPSPEGMLTAEQVMEKFWQNNDLDLYYLARVNQKKTKTVLVYGTNYSVYADAFTGEPIYEWQIKTKGNDFSGIKDKKILKMAQKLSDHGIIISTEKFSETDPVTYDVFNSLMGNGAEPGTEGLKLTRGAALIIFARSYVSDEVAKIPGIYKSPFSDISDDDPLVGYYAIAYGMGAYTGKKLDPKTSFTYGDMIQMVYTLYTAE